MGKQALFFDVQGWIRNGEMKLRVLDDQIRLRLDRDEVERLGVGNAVEGVTRFPDGAAFRYRLSVGDTCPTATFADSTISVVLRASSARRWANSQVEVSVRMVLSLDDDGELAVLVEKDFECLEPRKGESQTNRFPNPNAGRGNAES